MSRLAAGAITLPFLFALPTHVDPDATWRNVALGALVATVFVAALLLSHRMTKLKGGGGLVAAFAVLHLVLGLASFTTERTYTLSHALTDLGLLYMIFLCAAAAAGIAALLGRAVLAMLAIPLGIAAIVRAAHVQTFGFPMDTTGYRAIFQSSAGEALEFSGQFLGAGPIAAAGLALALVVAAALAAPPVRLSRKALAFAGALGVVTFPVLGENGVLVATRLQGFGEAAEYVAELREYRALLASRGARLPDIAIAREGPLAGAPQTYVFVVGESLTRNHMSLYGYWRRTTPELERLASEMAIFTDVVSPHSHTEQSLELVLTLANQSNGLRFTDRANYSLIEMLRAAGFATWWISNQHAFGQADNKTAVLASGADQVHFTSARSGRFIDGPLDEALLDPLASALQHPAPRKAIFLHFLGAHWDYAKRYPAQAAAFHELPTAAQIGTRELHNRRLRQVNHYDNAVRYHDRLAARVIEAVRAAGGPAVVVLFADHGENLYEFKAHYWTQFTRDHVEVPLILWFSPDYARLDAATVERARVRAGLPFALEDLPHLVADLAALRSTAFETDRSPLSEAYRAPSARALFEGALVYEEADDPLLRVRRTLGRIAQAQPQLRGSIWAHRVNTLGRMMETATTFPGAEIDVVYDARTAALVVNHPPAPPSGLQLDELLAYANRLNPRLALWFDLKNLDEANADRVIEALGRLDARHSIRSRTVVETGHTGPAAGALRRAGFLSSYYLPAPVGTQRTDCRGASEVRRIVESRNFAAVSFDWRARHWVERCLEALVRERGLRRYAWDLAPTLSDPAAGELLADGRLRAYARLTAVLLPYRSVFDDYQ